jgi:hypothetical protein
MATELFAMTLEERNDFLQMRADFRNQRQNVPLRSESERLHAAPDVYVVQPQDMAFIPGLLLANDPDVNSGTGSNPDEYDHPGVAECDVFRVVPQGTATDDNGDTLADLVPLGSLSPMVYNLTEFPIVTAANLVALRSKAGQWLGIPLINAIVGRTMENSGVSSGSIVAQVRVYVFGPGYSDNGADTGAYVTVRGWLLGNQDGLGIPALTRVLCIWLGANMAFAIPLACDPDVNMLGVGITAFPDGQVNQPYSFKLLGSLGVPPYHSWAATPLPAGLSLSGDTISGTPTASGDTEVVVTVYDSYDPNGSATATINLHVDADPSGTGP